VSSTPAGAALDQPIEGDPFPTQNYIDGDWIEHVVFDKVKQVWCWCDTSIMPNPADKSWNQYGKQLFDRADWGVQPLHSMENRFAQIDALLSMGKAATRFLSPVACLVCIDARQPKRLQRQHPHPSTTRHPRLPTPPHYTLTCCAPHAHPLLPTAMAFVP
jgi:hypothetical protein